MRKKILLLLCIALIASLLVLFFGLSPKIFHYAIGKRAIRLFAIILCGISIGLSTVSFQTITQNSILTPSLFGLDSLYLLIQGLIIFVLSPSSFLISNTYMNFTISFLLMALFSVLLFKGLFKKLGNIYYLLLVGVVFSTLFKSLISVIQLLMDPTSFDFFQSHMFASFNNIHDELLMFICLIVAGACIYLYKQIHLLDVLALGRDKAINLGISYDKEVMNFLLCIFLLVSSSTALVGPITFLGFLIVNLAKNIFKTFRHQILFPTSALLAIIVLAFGHVLTAEFLGIGVPISILINLIGGLYFIYILLREKLV